MPVPFRTLPPTTDPATKQNFDALRTHANQLETQVLALRQTLASMPPVPSMRAINRALSATGSHPLNLTNLQGTPAAATPAPPPRTAIITNPNNQPNTPPTFVACRTDLTAGQPAGIPASPNVRWMRGNFCGVRVPGLPFVQGGASDTTLVFSPFIDRYNSTDRASIFAAHAARGLTHFQLSWIDSRNYGFSVSDFIATAQEVQAHGFYPVIFLLGKGDDPNIANMAGNIDPVITGLISAGAMAVCCVGWEMSLWMDPTQAQAAINHVTALTVPAGVPTYIHLQTNYTAYPQPNQVTGSFWATNVGKLSGILFQGDVDSDCGNRQERIIEGLARFAGNAATPADSGFGHPFDFVAWELSAENQFFANVSETAGNTIGFQALCTPAQTGPAGTVGVMGFGNGATTPTGGIL